MYVLQSSPLVQAIGWTLLQSLWQIALVGIILWLLLNFVSKKSAQLSYAFSTSALLVICILTGITFSNYYEFSFSKKEIVAQEMPNIALPELDQPIEATTLETTTIEMPSASSVEETVFNLEMVLAGFVFVWLLGILFFGIKFTKGWFYLKFLKQSKLPLPNDHWQNRIHDFAERMGISKNVEFFLSEKIQTPITFGHFKPIILFPATMLTGLSDEQIEMLLLHELAHIRRSDFLVNLVQSILEVILFYHPMVWWISKQVRDSREHCCDDMAVAICKDRFLYAKTLTEIQSSISTKKSLAMSATGNQGSFTYRIQRLFQQSNHKSSYTKSIFSFGLLAICVMMFAFQSPFFESEEDKDYPNDGMLYVVTMDNPILELREIRNQLAEQNVKFEFRPIYDRPYSDFKSLHCKITMKDESQLQFHADSLQYLAISLDWSRKKPLSVLIKAKASGTTTYRGKNNFHLASIPQSNPGPTHYPCILENLAIGNFNSNETGKLFFYKEKISDVSYLLDGKKITPKKIMTKGIFARDVFSIIKYPPHIAKSKYNVESKRDGLIVITTRLNKHRTSVQFRNKKGCEKRKLIWGNQTFDYREAKVSFGELSQLKNQTIQIEHCDKRYDLISFGLSIKGDTKEYIHIEDFRKEIWKKKLVEHISNVSNISYIRFNELYTTGGIEIPLMIHVEKYNETRDKIHENKNNDNDKIVEYFNPSSLHLYYLKNKDLKNYAFNLNHEWLKLSEGNTLPEELLRLPKIDSILFVSGKYVDELMPNLESEIDTVIVVYTDFQLSTDKDCKRKILWGDKVFTDSNIELSVDEFLELKDKKISFDYCGTIHEMVHFNISNQNNTDKHYFFLKEKYNEGWPDEVSNKLSKPPYNQLLIIDGIRSTKKEVENSFSITVGDFEGVPYDFKDGEWVPRNKDIGHVGIMYNISPTYFQDWGESNHTFLLNEKELDSNNGLLPSEILNLNKVDSIIALSGQYARNAFPELQSDSIWSVYSNFQKSIVPKFSEKEKSDFEKSIQIHPNPMTNEAIISYELEEGQHVRLQIFDEQGKLITTIHDGNYTVKFEVNKLVYLEYWRPKNIPSGIYYARIEVGGEVFTKKIIKLNQ